MILKSLLSDEIRNYISNLDLVEPVSMASPDNLVDWWTEMAESCDESAEHYSDYVYPDGTQEGIDQIITVNI